MDDLLIRGGHLIDGSGAAGRDLDVSIHDGRIVALESHISRSAHRIIDARGQVVAPGFIDIHTHSDFTLPLNPRAESKIRQGVTTEVTGNCGFSVAPALPGRVGLLAEYLASSAPWLTFRESTFADYIAAFPPTSVNVIFQVGHNTLRLMTAGMDARPARADEQAAMATLLEEGLAAGAWGLSSGLFTAPGCHAEPAEIHALAGVLRRRGAHYSSHVRNEAAEVFAAVREAIAVAETTGVHVQIAHLKLSGVDNWGGADRLLGEIDAARRRGVPVDCDAYPYEAATNPLRNLLPSWVQDGGIGAMLERLQEPATRRRLRADVERDGVGSFGRLPSWAAVRVAVSPRRPDRAGLTLDAIARERGVDPFDALCDHLVEDRGATRVVFASMAEEDVRRISGTAWVLVGSDGSALATSGVTSQGMPHPRFYGTFARVAGPYVRELGLLSLPQAIHKMTGGSAAALGLTDRGRLREGAWADVTVFDPGAIADIATYEAPHRYAAGISTVVVNGEVVIDGGDHTGALPGRVLRRTG